MIWPGSAGVQIYERNSNAEIETVASGVWSEISKKI